MTDTTIESNPQVAPQVDELALADQEIAAMSAANYSTAEVECDMIMKGGITSGVVYPLTVCKLATKYRLHGIGGTSAGAIAAALAAAAEYRRQRGAEQGADPSSGFQALAQLPDEISQKLASLFQPHPDARGIFGVLEAGIDPEHHGLGRWRRIVSKIIAGQLGWFLAGVAFVLVVVLPGLVVATGVPIDGDGWWRIGIGLILPALLALAIGTLFAVVGLVLSALRILPDRDFGLTDGATYDATPALTEWLADKIDEVAGKKCLTLGDLWGKEAVDAWAAAAAKKKEPVGELRRMREIDLEMMTTDLTIRRPFRLPFSNQKLFFDRDEMLHLFPEPVVATMSTLESDHVNPVNGKRLYYFPGPGMNDDGEIRPGPDQLPVVVMARMSLSFPGLISAVPLYAVDHNGDMSVVRHLFSDGGISSNFPMHFFDSLLPTRPTFGVNLAPPHPMHPDQHVWRPQPNEGGWIPRAQPFDTVAGFGGALRDTIQNWSDNRQVTQRGYADRVVEIRLSAEEGGLNLRMPPDTIKRLVARGAVAGDKLIAPGTNEEPGFDWRAHRLMRYRIAMARLNDALEGLEFAFEEAAYPDLVTSYGDEPGKSFLGGQEWRRKELAQTGKLLDAVDAWEQSEWIALSVAVPSPAPVVRLAPE